MARTSVKNRKTTSKAKATKKRPASKARAGKRSPASKARATKRSPASKARATKRSPASKAKAGKKTVASKRPVAKKRVTTKAKVTRKTTTKKVAQRRSPVTTKGEFDFNAWLLPTLPLEQYEPDIQEEVGVVDKIKGSTRYAWIGAGQCGGRLVKSFHDLGYKKVLAVNTTHNDLD